MSITFKAFTSLIAEGKRAYSSESYWKGDAEEAGYKIKKLSGDVTNGDQTWGAFNDKDEKVGEFTEKEDVRGGWLIQGQLDEMFGVFRNNEKQKAEREEKEAKKRPARNAQRSDDEDEDEDEEEQDDKKKKASSETRSASTRGTKSTQSAAAKQQAEREAARNMK